MTGFDRELANRVALYLASQGGHIRTFAVKGTVPEVEAWLNEVKA